MNIEDRQNDAATDIEVDVDECALANSSEKVRGHFTKRQSANQVTKGEIWMRLLTTNLLAVALLLFGAASAGAYATTTSTSYDGSQTVSDSFTVTVHFDTEGGTGLILASVGIVFDTTQLQYMGGTSATYMLYTPAAGATAAVWMQPAATNLQVWGGTSPAPPLAKVNLDWISSGFPLNGTASAGTGDLGTLTFHILDASFLATLSTTGNGNVTQDLVGVQVNAGHNDVVVAPEPSTALLIGLGLIGLGVAGRKS
jgi:hypothetical protein